MGFKYRVKMSRLARAKQFAPFDALDGLGLALERAREEHEKKEKMILSEDQYDALNVIFEKIRRGDSIKVTYYEDGEYLRAEGIYCGADMESMVIKVGDRKIYADSIIKIIRAAG